MAVRVHDGRQRPASRLTADRLHFHDVSSQSGEELGGERQSLHLLQGEDPDSAQWR